MSGLIIHFALLLLFLSFLIDDNNPYFLPELIVLFSALISFYLGKKVKNKIWEISRLKTIIISIAFVICTTFFSYTIDNILIKNDYLNSSEAIGKNIINKSLPQGTFLTPNNVVIKNDVFDGKVIIIEVCYSSCSLCKRQFSAMEKLASIYAKNNNIKFYYVNAGNIDSYEKFKKYVDETKGKYSIEFLYDKDQTITNFSNEKYAPSTLIIDKKGNVQLFLGGYSKNLEQIFIAEVSTKINELK